MLPKNIIWQGSDHRGPWCFPLPTWQCARALPLSFQVVSPLSSMLLYCTVPKMTSWVHTSEWLVMTCLWEILPESQGHRNVSNNLAIPAGNTIWAPPLGPGSSGIEKELFNHNCSEWLQVTSLWSCSGHVQLGGDHGADQNTLEGLHIPFVAWECLSLIGRPGRFGRGEGHRVALLYQLLQQILTHINSCK